MPRRCQWASFGLAVPDHNTHDEIRIVKRCAKRMRQTVPEFASFMDRTRDFWRAMTPQLTRKRKRPEQVLQPFCVLAFIGIDFEERSRQVRIGNRRRRPMTGT